jgi:FkbM family methyltransferase
MIDTVFDRIWAAGASVRNRAKGAYLLGSLEPFLLRLAAHFPAPSKEVVVRLPGGMSMTVPPGYPSARSYLTNHYEPDVTRLVRARVRPGMTIVDAGANVGYYTLLASPQIGSTGQIYAFEPDPLNFTYLSRNIDSNGCSNSTALPIALAGTTGVGTFVRDVHGAEGFLTTRKHHVETLDVSVVTLDSFFEARYWPSVDLIKIDVEGSEASVLRGMHELSRRNPKLELIMELNSPALSRSDATMEDVAGLLRELGFHSYRVIESDHGQQALESGLPRTQATYNLYLVKA